MSSVAKDAFTSTFSKPLPWLAVIVIPLIVLIFGMLYSTTFIDPTERLKELPVAIVNLDEGTYVDGEQKNYGDELVDSIQEQDSALWTVEDESIVEEGLENSDYFMAVVIPSDFSESVAAGETGEPEQAEVVFYKNSRKNYLLSSISSNMENAIEQAVDEQIAEQYATALADGLAEAQDGFADAADGAEELVDGLTTADDGADALAEGADELVQATASLVSGADTLADGADELASGLDELEEASTTLSEGMGTLADGLLDLSAQSGTLTDASSAVTSGLSSLQAGSSEFLTSVESSMTALDESLGGLTGDEALAAAQSAYEQALQQYAIAIAYATATGGDASAVDTTELTAAVTTLAQVSAAVGSYEALEQIQDGYAELAAGITTLSSQYASLDAGIASYTSAADVLAEAAASASSGASSLVAGVQSAHDGAETLASGADALETGSTQLDAGVYELAAGIAELAEGLVDARDGASVLQDGLDDGETTIGQSLTTSSENMGAYVADPVTMTDDVYGELDSFGFGLSPLFLTLSLWLGSLLMFFIFKPYPSCELLAAGRARAIFCRWPAYLVFAVFNAAAALLAAAIVGIPCESWPLLAATLLCASFSFMCIMQFLNLFDIVGKAIAIVLVIFQLVFCSGTFPAELGTDIAQAVGPCLPFYYSIDAIREIMSGTLPGAVAGDIGMLLAFAAGAVVLSLAMYPLGMRMKRAQDETTVREITGMGIDDIRARCGTPSAPAEDDALVNVHGRAAETTAA